MVEAGEIGYLRHTYRHDEADTEVERLQLSDPPKCIGRNRADGGYTSHRASPMELLAFDPVASDQKQNPTEDNDG